MGTVKKRRVKDFLQVSLPPSRCHFLAFLFRHLSVSDDICREPQPEIECLRSVVVSFRGLFVRCRVAKTHRMP